jgi:hypothetical protein
VKLFSEETVKNARTNGPVMMTLMSTSIMLMQSLSDELLSFHVSSAFGFTKNFKANGVCSASSEGVETADLLDLRNEIAYSIGPTRYFEYVGLRPFGFVSGPGGSGHYIYPWMEPYECKRSDVLPIFHLSRLTLSKARPDLHYRHITQNSGDGNALAFFKNQYHKCREQHTKCQRNAPHNDFTPTRIMYVGSAEDEEVRLCDSVQLSAGTVYTVLSHCWGKNAQQIMLTKSTEETPKKGIALSSLPKTFQDAIAVTRMFQIQYIWIDSL